jgi:50S ribosomal subunit-associated GTPase HflX
VPISVQSGEGLEQLMAQLQEQLAVVENRVEILVPHKAGALHAEIRAKASVLSEFYTEQGCLMEIQVSPALLGRLLAEGARLQQPGDDARSS